MVTDDINKDTSVNSFRPAQHRISQAFASIQLPNYVGTVSSLIQYLVSIE